MYVCIFSEDGAMIDFVKSQVSQADFWHGLYV